MKWFEIENQEQAEVLRAYTLGKQSVGNIVSPSANSVTVTDWPDYPEADRLSFDQCMSIVRDEVTEDVLREIGPLKKGTYYVRCNVTDDINLLLWPDGTASIEFSFGAGTAFDRTIIPNPTATKLRILAAILQGKEL
jgi:hypothetical protein